MDILNTYTLKSNSKFKIDFNGGDLSSDAGLLLIKEFAAKIGFDQVVQAFFKAPAFQFRRHCDIQNLNQSIYQILAAYFTDDAADALKKDPVFTYLLDKPALASQPTLSRFFKRLDEKCLDQFDQMNQALRKMVYAIEKPSFVLLDLDSTLLATYGKQEGHAFNFHYQANGYHPLLCYDGLTGDLLKAELRDGAAYCGKDADRFMAPLFDEYAQNYPDIDLYLRADSGFAFPELYSLCEEKACGYTIRLKENPNLKHLCQAERDQLTEQIKHNIIDYQVIYGEFLYQANSWDKERRVVFKIEKPYGQFDLRHTFIVSNLSLSPKQTIDIYCNRGRMENFIKEGKNGFDFAGVSSQSKVVNANRLQVHALAYNLFNYFRRLVLPTHLKRNTIDTIRLKLIKVAARVVHSARSIYFKLSSSCPYKKDFYSILDRIQNLSVKLE